ncbi:WhiB family transcriptional regulator [Tsukamurella paurometabola]|nr:WhiB family transcriptional regulator [Tsukamurella paurometabola]UEA82591.1 WhiB family transcriptional regulator [Tsukamurella paurometabola]
MPTIMEDRPVERTVRTIDSISITRPTRVENRVPCRAGDPDLWFAEAPSDLERAKTLCGTCPLQRACLAAALERGEPWGVWGGQIFEQGVVIARKRPRGRPRKNAA